MPTLLQLRDRVREESDNVGSTFVTDAEANKYINASYGELYGLIAQKFGDDYFVQTPPTSITTDGTNQLYALATDVFKVVGVELQITTGQFVSLRPFAFADRNRYGYYSTPYSGQVVRYYYVPRFTPLAVDASATVTAIDIGGWDEYIVVDAAIKVTGKEDNDASLLMARKQALINRLEAESENRDAGMPAKIVDAAALGGWGMAYRLAGEKLWLIGQGLGAYAASGWGYPPDDWWP